MLSSKAKHKQKEKVMESLFFDITVIALDRNLWEVRKGSKFDILKVVKHEKTCSGIHRIPIKRQNIGTTYPELHVLHIKDFCVHMRLVCEGIMQIDSINP